MAVRNRVGIACFCALGIAGAACGSRTLPGFDLDSTVSGPGLDAGTPSDDSSVGDSSSDDTPGISPDVCTSAYPLTGGATLLSAPSASTAPWLSFDSDQTGVRAIYFIRSDGTNLVREVTSTANESEAVFSPDGTKIAFTSDACNEIPQIYVREVATNLTKQLTARPYGHGAHQPAWSPDGSLIAYVGLPSAAELDAGNALPSGIPGIPAGAADLYVLHPDGTGQRDVLGTMPSLASSPTPVYPQYYPSTPTFSADSTTLVFAEYGSLNVIGTDGSGLRNIWPIGDGPSAPCVSANGAQVAFALALERGIDGVGYATGPTTIGEEWQWDAANPRGHVQSLSWSPTNEMLIGTTSDAAGIGIYVYAVPQSDAPEAPNPTTTPMKSGMTNPGYPRWAPPSFVPPS
jgi:hypothetical protein